ncbi:uncharacterized protein EURHEDRAFT_109279 [Aspergillus ruber CBS 135680]|uniref:Uncharacterized protein n=1 Tax=Aspergillus ruber (strain CBS 135680) TaxID=1388766 RepID=A0A017SAH3_ASPRC|nr:uncharacterized protein EURHEDRAFT_109279 [Aspergillus ruber CBS 135680]EYE93821.1 hypothetical protein EURHEDRAFT_109279 [Aspergillus ruber CBS 135680]
MCVPTQNYTTLHRHENNCQYPCMINFRVLHAYIQLKGCRSYDQHSVYYIVLIGPILYNDVCLLATSTGTGSQGLGHCGVILVTEAMYMFHLRRTMYRLRSNPGFFRRSN